MIRDVIERLVGREDITEQAMMGVMEEVMEGRATPAQIAAFITALRMKGETVPEVTGAARIMRQRAIRIDARSSTVVDTCGTGGDGAHTFNISTTAAFVVAAAGVTVAKHGNRAVSSGCGSADVLEALGVNVSAPPEVVEECIQHIHLGFLFAPRLHGAMKHAVGPRSEIAIRTIFNLLGPLTNPAGANCQLIGVYDPRLTEMFAGVLKNLGARRALVVHGLDGLDEATVTAPTRVSELKEGLIRTYNLDPRDLLGRLHRGEDLKGGDPSSNAEIARGVLSGQNGACRDIVVLNAALALVAADRVADLREGVSLAQESIDSGAAIRKLQALIEGTHG
jgi:anthranilate phosphoribosyltransferase